MNSSISHPFPNLNQTERSILYIAMMDASASVVKIASVLGCKQHTVQAAYTKFRTLGLIVRRVMIDTFRLGYSRHSLLIELSPEGQRNRPQLTRLITEHQSTAVVRDVVGNYDLLVDLIVRSPEELANFHDLLASHFTSPIQSKDLSICLRHSIFGEKSLAPNTTMLAESTYAVTSHVVHIDHLDRQLLFLMCSPSFTSLAQLARDTTHPLSTIDYRVKKLKDRQVICADLLDVRGDLLRLSNFILLVMMKGFPHYLQDEFHAFVREHPHVTYYSHHVGTWDFMLGVSMPHSMSIQTVINAVHQRFGDYVASINTLEVGHTHKIMDFPLYSIPEHTERSAENG